MPKRYNNNTEVIFDISVFRAFLKVSTNPNLTILHTCNFGFLYDLINLRNSFCLKKNPQKNVIHMGIYLVKTILSSQLCSFSFDKPNTKERKKAFSCESAADPASRQRFFPQPRRMATISPRTWTQIRYEWKAVGLNEFSEAILNFSWKKLKKHVSNLAVVC